MRVSSVSRYHSTAVSSEVRRFGRDMDRWWDEEGPARALHQLNPLRARLLSRWWGRPLRADDASPARLPLSGLSVLDVGCGGGLLSESLARLGATVTGVDASKEAVEVARAHAATLMPTTAGKLEYRVAVPEEMRGEMFDFVVSSEVIEHVSDPELFVAALAPLARKGIVISTLNRTAKSYLAAIVLGEYVIGLVPPGTHNWEKFLTPEELTGCFEKVGFLGVNMKGLRYNPWIPPYWTEASDLDVNYIASFRRKE